MHSHFSEFNHNAGTAMSRYIINSTCVTTKLRQNFKVTTFLSAFLCSFAINGNDVSADLISSKAQRMLNVLYRTYGDMNDISTKKWLHIAWVRSRLEYATLVWSPHTKRNIQQFGTSWTQGYKIHSWKGLFLVWAPE